MVIVYAGAIRGDVMSWNWFVCTTIRNRVHDVRYFTDAALESNLTSLASQTR